MEIAELVPTLKVGETNKRMNEIYLPYVPCIALIRTRKYLLTITENVSTTTIHAFVSIATKKLSNRIGEHLMMAENRRDFS